MTTNLHGCSFSALGAYVPALMSSLMASSGTWSGLYSLTARREYMFLKTAFLKTALV
jgi:hypothetical protein